MGRKSLGSMSYVSIRSIDGAIYGRDLFSVFAKLHRQSSEIGHKNSSPKLLDE